MAVYVDNFYDTGVTYRGMKMCHMVADTQEELLAMVDKIGVQRKWIQYKGTANEHFDIAYSKRCLAVKHGAKEIHFKEYATFVNKRAAAHSIEWTHTSITQLPLNSSYYSPYKQRSPLKRTLL
jgi:hypothetical protein